MFGPAAWARPTPRAATAASATTATMAAVRARRGFMVLAPSSEDRMRADTAERRRAVFPRGRRPPVAAQFRQIFQPTPWSASGSREIVAPYSDATAALPPRRSRDAARSARVGGRRGGRFGLLLPVVRNADGRRRVPALAAARLRPARLRGLELLARPRPLLELGPVRARGADGGDAPRRDRGCRRLVVGQGVGRGRAPDGRRRRGARRAPDGVGAHRALPGTRRREHRRRHRVSP